MPISRHTLWWHRCLGQLVVLMATCNLISTASGQTWNNANGGAWNAAANWTLPMAVPDGNNASVIFADKLAADAAVGIDKGYAVGFLTFNSSRTYTLQASQAAGQLNFGSLFPSISVDINNSAEQRIAVPLGLANGRDFTVTNDSAVRLTTSSAISGNGNVISFLSVGETYLKATNTFKASKIDVPGVLSINADAALGDNANPVSVRRGGILSGLDGDVTIGATRELRIRRQLLQVGEILPIDAVLGGFGGILTVDAKTVNDADNTTPEVHLDILGKVRFTNVNNTFGGAGSDLTLGDANSDGNLYFSSDAALGAAQNKLIIQRGGLVLEDSLSSSRPIDYQTTATLNVVKNGFLDKVSWKGVISGGPGPLIKQGPGELELTADNTFQSLRIESGIVSTSKDASLGKAGAQIELRHDPLGGSKAELFATDTFTTARNLKVTATDVKSVNQVSVISGKVWSLDGVIFGDQLTVLNSLDGEFRPLRDNQQNGLLIRAGRVGVSRDLQLGAANSPVTLESSGKVHALDTFTSGRPYKMGFTGASSGIEVDKDKTLTITSGITGDKDNTAAFSKTGLGTLELAKGSTSDVFGSFTIDNGLLRLNGDLNARGGLFAALATGWRGTGKITAGVFNNKGRVTGGNSPGTLTLEGVMQMDDLSEYGFDINSATGQPGGALGWSFIDVLGPLQFGGTHAVVLNSLGLDDQPGPLGPGLFDPSHDYAWELTHARDGIVGFDPTLMPVDASGFLNPLAPGRGFHVAQVGDSLFLEYGVVPEPETLTLFLTGLATVGLMWRFWSSGWMGVMSEPEPGVNRWSKTVGRARPTRLRRGWIWRPGLAN